MKFSLDKRNATETSKLPSPPLPYPFSLCPDLLFESWETDSVQRLQAKAGVLFFSSKVKLERRKRSGSYANRSHEALNFLATPTHAFFISMKAITDWCKEAIKSDWCTDNCSRSVIMSNGRAFWCSVRSPKYSVGVNDLKRIDIYALICECTRYQCIFKFIFDGNFPWVIVRLKGRYQICGSCETKVVVSVKSNY